MRFVSTRGTATPLPFSAALTVGLAADGGLYVPEHLPHLGSETLAALPHAPLAAAMTAVLAPLLGDDVLAPHLPALCSKAASFEIPLRQLYGPADYQLELFHGPTAAFKDLAAGFLAAALTHLRRPQDPAQTVLVATSGDTGAAVAAAFHRRPGFRVLILYPDGRVSAAQAHSLGAFGDNVRALRVAGSFDDCQRLVKQALADQALRAELALVSANSISLGRLLPQMGYYATHALAFEAAHGRALNFIIPSGNLGNALAALMARAMGLPVGAVILATNSNQTLSEFFSGQPYRGRDAIATLANAMDVGAPSNFERLLWLANGDAGQARRLASAVGIDDDRIRATLANASARHGVVPCPHTACALAALEDLRAAGDERPFAVVATAHAGKFRDLVEPLALQKIAVPPAFAALLERPAVAKPLAADYQALLAELRRP